MDPGRGALRLTRGGLLATCCVLLGVSAHVLGGGAPPAAAPTVIASAAIGLAAVAWCGPRRGFGSLVAACAVAQAAFHLTLTLAPEHHSQHAAGLDARMLLGHGLATLVMAGVLARGDAVLDALIRLTGHVVVRLAPALSSDRPLARPRPVHRTMATVVVLGADAAPRRGPPRPAAA